MKHLSRILLTGPNGQVGWELQRSLVSLGDVVALGREGLDLRNPDEIRAVVREVKPSVIVNAAAYTAVDKAEDEPDLAMTINGAAPGVLAEEAKRFGAAIVHYSTDYVFDGGGDRPWHEDDQPNPLNEYGRSKLAGERAIQAVGVAHLILRTSWVYGLHGNNFVKTMLRLGAEREELSVVDDQVGAPTSARVIADITGQILAQGRGDVAGLLRERGGVVHLSCRGETSWRGFAEAIFRLARERGVPLTVGVVKPVAGKDYPSKAVRPGNSRLDNQRLPQRFSLCPPAWEVALEQSFPGEGEPVDVSPQTPKAYPDPPPSKRGLGSGV